MKNWPLFAIISIVAVSASFAKAEGPLRPRTALAFKYNYQPSFIPLATEKVWGLDPDELNPHRSRWVLQRQTDLVGLQSKKLADGRFGVTAIGIAAAAKSYMRPQGEWYRPLSEFPCTEKPVDWFATEDGTKKAVETAAILWRDLMSGRRMNLEVQLDGISATTSEIALLLARHLFQTWLRQLDETWRTTSYAEVRRDEWKLYAELAKATQACPKPKGVARAVPWVKMMEPVPTGGPPKLLVRAPARRWSGLYSVRLNLTIGTQKLNGQFLLDSSAPVSIVSPAWLENQGFLPIWTQIQGGRAERVAGVLWSHSGLARRGIVETVEMSGVSLPLREFLLYDTDFFNPPENVASCCDGVLGMDFLSNYVVEFSPGPPAEIKLWERANYHLPDQGYIWTELAAERREFKGLVSSCGLFSARSELKGVRWNTASTAAVQVHTPYKTTVKKAPVWKLSCDGGVLASELKVGLPKFVTNGSGLDAKSPATDIGMGLLSRGSFVFDLPHGRIWLSPESSGAHIPENRSGLSLKYVLKKGDRVLIVDRIQRGTPAEALSKAGLKVGMELTQVNSRPADELDQWEIEQILSGAHGEQVTFRWDTASGTKIAPLSVSGS
ncbi:MAG: hypothetical protein A2X94_04500 [Bdellovibrionales bacterium GWB1_55_8]|nr:MAG: hypothetical protein A2X94_04500 [Bdellovibrionales bacterium GWB1_55_8]